MAVRTPCQTPDAQFSIRIERGHVACTVFLPHDIDWDEDEAALLEANLHNAVELVLARYFTGSRR